MIHIVVLKIKRTGVRNYEISANLLSLIVDKYIESLNCYSTSYSSGQDLYFSIVLTLFSSGETDEDKRKKC